MSLVPAQTTASLPFPRMVRSRQTRMALDSGKEFGFRKLCFQALRDGGTSAGNEQVLGFFQKTLGDGGYLLRRLALPEDHFRQAVAQAAVVI
jgi:hypothetical protein